MHPPLAQRAKASAVVLCLALAVIVSPLIRLGAQMPDDAKLLPQNALSAGVIYAHDQWDHYWEGRLKRTNGNVGTVTTQSLTMIAGYGVTNRLGVMVALPYVWTEASQGTLHGMRGLQDLSVTAKYRVVSAEVREGGVLNAFVSATAALPASDYTPDFLPLSIGTGGARAAARATLGYQARSKWFMNASAGYVFCNNVKLDRPSYFTNGQLYLTNDVAMPNVTDYVVTAGYRRGRVEIPVSIVQQRTLGGGDIRRQDMPFVSNRMDFTRVNAAVAYALSDVSLRFGAGRVLNGRNVGQSTTFTTRMSYAFQF